VGPVRSPSQNNNNNKNNCGRLNTVIKRFSLFLNGRFEEFNLFRENNIIASLKTI
jgi:hypothetical protein